jgi:hypothetical protein
VFLECFVSSIVCSNFPSACLCIALALLVKRYDKARYTIERVLVIHGEKKQLGTLASRVSRLLARSANLGVRCEVLLLGDVTDCGWGFHAMRVHFINQILNIILQNLKN